MKKSIFFIFLFTLFSCDEVLIEENSRIQIKGTLTSPDNDVVTGVNVISAGTYENWVSSNTDKILGRDISDENGYFDFISLDTYSHDLLLAVNPENIDHNSEYSSLYFFDPTGDHAKFYDLGDLQLAKKLEYQFNIERTSQTGDTLRYVLEYKKPVKRFEFENGNFTEREASDGNFITIREHRPESEPVTHTLSIMEATELVFLYSLGDDPLQEIILPVSVENNSYDFEY